MALAALANIAAATTAGYKEIVHVGLDSQTYVLLEKPLTGDPDGGSGLVRRAYGVGATQGAAETMALAALNDARLHRYGADTGATSTGKKNGNSHTRDVT